MDMAERCFAVATMTGTMVLLAGMAWLALL